MTLVLQKRQYFLFSCINKIGKHFFYKLTTVRLGGLGQWEHPCAAQWGCTWTFCSVWAVWAFLCDVVSSGWSCFYRVDSGVDSWPGTVSRSTKQRKTLNILDAIVKSWRLTAAWDTSETEWSWSDSFSVTRHRECVAERPKHIPDTAAKPHSALRTIAPFFAASAITQNTVWGASGRRSILGWE